MLQPKPHLTLPTLFFVDFSLFAGFDGEKCLCFTQHYAQRGGRVVFSLHLNISVAAGEGGGAGHEEKL
jgi:hypothetical protein